MKFYEGQLCSNPETVEARVSSFPNLLEDALFDFSSLLKEERLYPVSLLDSASFEVVPERPGVKVALAFEGKTE